ncbi:MAG TPA: DUF1841 family protein [Rhodocyclaceae bacterium]
MFNPSRDQARRFLVDAWRKRREHLPATPLETIAADIVGLHPEYHVLLESGEEVLDKDWQPDAGETNPFLHLSLHLAIAEQLQIDQPPGIRNLAEQLSHQFGERHAALHAILDALAETIWRAQRDQKPLDSDAYLAAIRQQLKA